jgi:hypothetical protein
MDGGKLTGQPVRQVVHPVRMPSALFILLGRTKTREIVLHPHGAKASSQDKDKRPKTKDKRQTTNDNKRQRHLHETALCFRGDVSERGQHMNTRENQVVPVPLSTDVGRHEEGRRSTVTPAAFVLIRKTGPKGPTRNTREVRIRTRQTILKASQKAHWEKAKTSQKEHTHTKQTHHKQTPRTCVDVCVCVCVWQDDDDDE